MTRTAPTNIDRMLKNMGYVIAKPTGKVKPSYYKLEDGTIIAVSIHVNHLVPDPKNPNGFNINSTNTVTCYVEESHRHPELFDPNNTSDPQSSIVNEDMDVKVLREDFSQFNLSNGTILSVKPVVSQVDKTSIYNQTGEPLYMIGTAPIAKFKVKR